MIKQAKLLTFCVLILSLFCVPLSYADDLWSKLGRGASNVIFSPGEILMQPSYMSKTERWPVAFFGGVPKGLLMMGARIVVGAYELATFPIPAPKGYEPILQPEFVLPGY